MPAAADMPRIVLPSPEPSKLSCQRRVRDGYCLAAVAGLRIFCKNFWCSPDAAANSVCTVLASAASFFGSALPDFSSRQTLSSAVGALF